VFASVTSDEPDVARMMLGRLPVIYRAVRVDSLGPPSGGLDAGEQHGPESRSANRQPGAAEQPASATPEGPARRQTHDGSGFLPPRACSHDVRYSLPSAVHKSRFGRQ